MPRVVGYREQINMNVWDAFSPRDFAGDTPEWREVRLFGNRNIGHEHLTNMVVAGQVAGDQTMIIMNWYARTNVMDALDVEDRSPLARAWHAFRHATLVTMVVGCAPIAQRPLADLIGPRHQGFGGNGDPPETSASENAERVYEAYRAHMISGAYGSQIEHPFWDALSSGERDKWLHVALSIRPLHIPVMVPTRQCFSVRVKSEPRALGQLLEIMPKSVAPQTLIWVHLDGILSRDAG